MLTGFALIFLTGLLLGEVFKKIKLPSLIGMIIGGIILSPILDKEIINIAGELRQIALVIILTRAGLSLNISELKKVGRPAILMCFLPACFEIIGIIIIAPIIFEINMLEAAIMGSVLAAVSPAVIVPRMIKLIDEGYGVKESIPQLILAGASADDVFVIVLFTAFTSLASGGKVSVGEFIQVPIAIIIGIIGGGICGFLLNEYYRRVHIRDTVKMIIMISLSFLLLQIESSLKGIVPFSGLIAIMSMGIIMYKKNNELAGRLQKKYNKLWVGAEILLFVLVGASVDLNYAKQAGIVAIIVVIGGLIFRMIGVFICLIKTRMKGKEKIFCMLAYTPKATVQAAIGAVPLAMGLNCGNKVLTVAVLAILITAPFGAICVDKSYKKLLSSKK